MAFVFFDLARMKKTKLLTGENINKHQNKDPLVHSDFAEKEACLFGDPGIGNAFVRSI